MKNYLNSNDIFTILELIRSELKKYKFDIERESLATASDVIDEAIDTITDTVVEDRVNNVEFFRNQNDLINSVVVNYESGVIETIVFNRGVFPPISNHPDEDYLNNVLITGFVVVNEAIDGTSTSIEGNVIRENGIGRFTKLEFNYS